MTARGLNERRAPREAKPTWGKISTIFKNDQD